jgi:P4 family phage/plasmid primase-like protien
MATTVSSKKFSIKPGQPQHIITNTQYKNYQDFIARHYVDKGDRDVVITNTRIGKPGGRYHISDSEYDLFLDLYYRDIVSKGANEFLTEKQLESGGPIAVDLDLRHDYAVAEKQYTRSHIDDLITLYLDELKNIYSFDDKAKFPIYIFEKPTVNRVADKQITKDGIHMIIGIQADRITQTTLRNRIVSEIANLDSWSELPIKNNWSDVFDEGISRGCTNWQLYGSKKPDHDTYRLTQYYEIEYDASDQEMICTNLNIKKFDFEKEFKKLSIRYRHHLSPMFTTEYFSIHESMRDSSLGGPQPPPSRLILSSTPNTNLTRKSTKPITINHMAIRNREDLEHAVQFFLDSLSATDYELVEAHSYAMALPRQYYAENSYSKWIRTGWALCNISKKLLISWIAFSAKYERFDFSSIPDLIDRWSKFDTQNECGLTKRSIMYWCREDAIEEYEKVRQNSIDYYIDQTMKMGTNASGILEKGVGTGDSDIAFILKQLFKDQYICASVKQDKWFRFDKHRWVEDECGTSLRRHISEELREIYRKKANAIVTKMIRNNMLSSENNGEDCGATKPSKGEKRNPLEEKSARLMEIAIMLSRTKDKDHIMKEARELFFDRDIKFLDLLDSNPYLMCFKNGVWDFKEKKFRAGRAEDYISKCTNIDYHPLDRTRDAKIIAEIEDFMSKLFPIEQVKKYMWEHLASVLIGTNLNQTFNMYIGGGENGKSVLTDLMSQILGDYKSDAPLALITQARIKQGQASPDIVALKGIRYAVMQEPSKGDKINEGALKELTSGTEPIRGRNLFSSPITFIPQMKLVVCTNEFMEVKTRDHATWRRFRVVDFVSLFTDNPVADDPEKPFQFKIDRKLKERFPEWREVFISMLVDIVLRTDGYVQDCAIVSESTNKYKEKEDHIAEFIRDRIIQDPTGKIAKQEISNEFSMWYQSMYSSRGGPSIKEVHEYLDKRFGRFKSNLGAWTGIRIKYDRGEAATILPDDVEVDDVQACDL